MPDYTTIIKESLDELRKLEKAEKNGKIRDRIKFFRLLKEGTAESAIQAGLFVGISTATAYRLLKTYREDGLQALFVLHYKGRIPTIGFHGEAKFRDAANQRSFRSLKEVQAWFHQEFGVEYTIAGTSLICKRLKVKLKTQRPSNPKQEPGAIEDYQKKVS